ncbi:hypothetical protein [Rhodococcus sp. IEGM 1330]|uniref:hypothetical protein n=1 Tax=Rhodococcus sp. IEGM 1330 TaxID=3082225 RepID=UPI0029544677|nr:hypothetical protein [Rhodococcus sp. IEGM 1330]MDV8022313.1 hypothetical protein [Rhodococcus sp. IEGM 1330]
MNDYIQVDHGRIVTGDVLEKPERHLTLVASDNWPTEADTDPYERDRKRRNPVGAASLLSLACLAAYIGFVRWAAIN